MKVVIEKITSFFIGSGQFQPVYFWITLFCALVAIAVIMKLSGVKTISDGLILGMLGFVQVWVLMYNRNKKDIS